MGFSESHVVLLLTSTCLAVAKVVAKSRESQRPVPTELDSSSPLVVSTV